MAPGLSAPPEGPPYTVFTRDFDVVCDAGGLDRVLGRPSQADQALLLEAWRAFSQGLLAWRTAAIVESMEAARQVRERLPDAALRDVAVTILVDQSGSMRGQAMLLAAAACDIAQNWLRHLGPTVEVAGFTTVGWRGGRSRRRWRSQWWRRPGHP